MTRLQNFISGTNNDNNNENVKLEQLKIKLKKSRLSGKFNNSLLKEINFHCKNSHCQQCKLNKIVDSEKNCFICPG